jgi:hypothetical protein
MTKKAEAALRDDDDPFNRADAAVERAVAVLIKKIEALMARRGRVAPSYIAEHTLLELCAAMSRLTDEPFVRNHAGPATVKLANALADYRDSQPEDRVP